MQGVFPQQSVALLVFLPDGQTVRVKTCSPKLDKYMSDDAKPPTNRQIKLKSLQCMRIDRYHYFEVV